MNSSRGKRTMTINVSVDPTLYDMTTEVEATNRGGDEPDDAKGLSAFLPDVVKSPEIAADAPIIHGAADQIATAHCNALLRTGSPASAHLSLPSAAEVSHRQRWTLYNKCIVGLLAANCLVLLLAIRVGWLQGLGSGLEFMSAAAQSNLVVAVLFRQQYFINFIGWAATRPSTRWPLRIRAMLAKYYQLGGLHVGAGVAGMLWSICLLFSMIVDQIRGQAVVSALNVGLVTALAVSLLGMAAMARPSVRATLHDHFEWTHRFGAWCALALSWASAMQFAAIRHPGASLAAVMAATPMTWALVLSTIFAVWPWLLLRKIPVTVLHRSKHAAIIHLGHDMRPEVGTTRAISRHPLIGWHQFGIAPSQAQKRGYCMIVSRAGDWTGAFVDHPPGHVWVRGIPTVGVANARRLFRKIVFLLTGSGIGPGLSHLLANELPTKLIWITKDPRRTYGDTLVDQVLQAQPDALIWNTDERGKPDVFALTYQTYLDVEAEAVICICNKTVTFHVVHGMEQRGIPAFGPIWDS
jgi:hypothetical protein